MVSVTFLLIFLSHIRDDKVNDPNHESPIETNNNSIVLNNNNNTIITKKSATVYAQQSFYDKLLESFSIRKNWHTIINDSPTADSIPIINGLKYNLQ